MDNTSRQQKHKKHKGLESIFPELENILGNSEIEAIEHFSEPQKKVYLIVGCARSGSTLLYQYLAKSDYFVYPTNFLSRFYYAPYIGYRIQQALIDFDLKGEIFQQTEDNNNFSSNLGKTKGPKQAHEFWYFWNRFFKFKELQQLSDEEIDKVDWLLFKKELHALEEVSGRPILMKAMNLNWNLLDLKKHLPNIHFIYLKRDVLYNAQSLLKSRKDFFGNYNDWYSFKTPNYYSIKNLPVEQQVVEQVINNNEEIEKQLKSINSQDKSIVSYADFCDNPLMIINDLKNKGANDLKERTITFNVRDKQTIPGDMFNKLIGYINSKDIK